MRIQPIRLRVYNYGGFRFRKYDPDTADLIVAVDGKRVRNVDELLTAVEAHNPGEVVRPDGRPRWQTTVRCRCGSANRDPAGLWGSRTPANGLIPRPPPVRYRESEQAEWVSVRPEEGGGRAGWGRKDAG